MDTDFLSLSPSDKIDKYNEVNSNGGYVDYIPNGTSTNVTSAPKVNLNLLTNTSVPTTPLLSRGSDFSFLSEAGKDKTVKASDLPTTLPTIPAEGESSKQKVPIIPYKTVNPNDAAKQAFNYYVQQKKLPAHVAAGIIGNLYQESGLNPTRKENNGGNGRGIAQWDVRDRWPAFQKWAMSNGKDPNSLNAQLDYVLVEPGQENAIRKTMTAKDSDTAAMLFGKLYEKPNAAAARWDIRQGIARTLLNL